uniref:TNFR-Cys domain-containing protein n=1 Tax=Denticeps clupeoides TaxID=299321 RepID=A0AAY4BFD4_9TELE
MARLGIMSKFTYMFVTCTFLFIIIMSCYGCKQAEYGIDSECCPMCSPGYFVHRHCTEYTSTTCLPCPSSTFIGEPSGLEKCRSCTTCDTNLGLRIQKNCTSVSDTTCDPLEGNFCSRFSPPSCSLAQKHTQCEPGQYIKQNGTASTDTVCTDCVGDTYSDGSFSTCRSHTQCKLMRKGGTSSSDAECEDVVTIIVIILSLLLVVTMMLIFFWCWQKRNIPV